MSLPLGSLHTADAEVQHLKEVLLYKRQIILQGPPGTGKTRLAKDIAELILTDKVSTEKSAQKANLQACPEYKLVQFHPSYTYEDFVRGIEVRTDGDGTARYEATDRILAKFAKVADSSQGNPHVLIIDEINRANLSSVLGELIYALEYRGQPVDSMYAVKEGNGTETHRLVLPKNLYIIGTMNTADRSAGHLDYAIRRRFAFVDVLPRALDSSSFDSALFNKVKALFTTDNFKTHSEYLSEEFQPKDVALGHSYFIAKSESLDSRTLQLEYDIKPILFEYVKDGVLKDTALERIRTLKIESTRELPRKDLESQRQLFLDAITLFEDITNNAYKLWSHNHTRTANTNIYKRVYAAPLLNTDSLHYEFLLDSKPNQITIDFHIESGDRRHEEVAKVLSTFTAESLGFTDAKASLIKNWQNKRVGYRFALSDIEQTPRILAESMVKLITNSADKLRRPLLSHQTVVSVGQQEPLL